MESETPGDWHVIFREYLDAVGLQGMAGAEAAGLQPTEWYAVSVISLAGSITSGDLAARTGLTTGATTRLVDRLEKAGYVRRSGDPGDRRRVLIEASGDTFPDVEEVVGPARRRIAEVVGRYTPEQREVLFDYFAQAAPAYRAATEEIRSAASGHRRPGRKPKGAGTSNTTSTTTTAGATSTAGTTSAADTVNASRPDDGSPDDNSPGNNSPGDNSSGQPAPGEE